MTEFNGNLGVYKIIPTEDNTETIWSEYFNEACHNLSGAYEETIHNYILGCSIPDLINQSNKMAILDVGFGVGIGLKAIIDQIHNSHNHSSKKFYSSYYYSIELDETLLLWSLKNTLPQLKLDKKRIETDKEPLFYYHGHCYDDNNENSLLDITIFVGDGRITLPLAHSVGLLKPLDAIFQDAFSPKKNPTLWSVEWFQFLKEISHQNVQMATYSSSISIRKSLIRAGWVIKNAKGFALKRSMTKASLVGETSPELLLQLSQSPSLEINDK